MQTMCIWYSNGAATKHDVKTHKDVMHPHISILYNVCSTYPVKVSSPAKPDLATPSNSITVTSRLYLQLLLRVACQGDITIVARSIAARKMDALTGALTGAKLLSECNMVAASRATPR